MVLLAVTHHDAPTNRTSEDEGSATAARAHGATRDVSSPSGTTSQVVQPRRAGTPHDLRLPAAAQGTTPPGTAGSATPTVGGLIRAARESREWDIDELVRRTSLSPHIIRGVEADDFSASRGDCYARGHLRILARTLSLDEATLLAAVPVSDPLDGDDECDPGYDAPPPRLRHATTALLLLTAMIAALLVALLLT